VLVTILSVFNAILLLVMIVFLYIFKESIPDLLQGALNDVGSQLSEVFEKPQVKRAMTLLGKESGVVRADAALKNRVAEKALGQSIVVKKALDWFGLTALEGVELMRDPTFGPIIQGFIEKGGQGLLGGFNNPGGGRAPPRSRGVPLMS